MADKRRGPAVARRQLRLRLRRARQEAGKTQVEVADALDWSPSKVLRIENGQSSLSVSDLLALLTAYPNLQAERGELIELARKARRPRVAEEYRDVYPPELRDWFDFVGYAEVVQVHEPRFVPVALRTIDYATALAEALQVGADRIDRIVEADAHWSEALVSSGGPRTEFIIDEGVLRRALSKRDRERGDHAMIEQLTRLARLNTRGRRVRGESVEPDLNPEISVQLVPLELGPYALIRESFELIQLHDDDDPYLVHLERGSEHVILDRHEELETYVDQFDQLKKQLPGAAETSEWIEAMILTLGASSDR